MRRGVLIAAAVAYVWFRMALILMVPAFETPDTASYRSGQGTRPVVGALLLDVLPGTIYVVLSAFVSTAGFLAFATVIWRRATRWAHGAAVAVLVCSLLPMVIVYEHWLVPDSLLVGSSLIAIALALSVGRSRRAWVGLVAVCAVLTLTKELGAVVVVLVALVVAAQGFPRQAAALGTAALAAFALVVLPASDRPGIVLWHQPPDTELTMERFRVLVSGLLWSDLSPELAEVRVRAAECGMTFEQLMAETFLLTDRIVAFRGCDELWEVVDELNQVDVLLAHVANPNRLPSSLERGFAANMKAMAGWSGRYDLADSALLPLDRIVAAGVAVLPVAALGVALARRSGRRLACIALAASGCAVVSILVDPTGQDRHSIGFRVVAMAIAVAALTSRREADAESEADAVQDLEREVEQHGELTAERELDHVLVG